MGGSYLSQQRCSWHITQCQLTSDPIRLCLAFPSTEVQLTYPTEPNYPTLTIFTSPSARAGYDTRSIFKWSLTGLKSEFSFSLTCCSTKAEEPSLPYNLPIAGGRIIGFIPFPRVLVLCEMQSPPGFELMSPCPFPTTITITPLLTAPIFFKRSRSYD